ncbi:MAG: pyrroline-5-carboxylate reductase, partial [Desulfovibrionaceae bacterium]
MAPAIGFIGLGNMGAAIVRGLRDLEVWGIDLNAAHVQALKDDCGLHPAASVAELADHCDYLLLAVKPQHAEAVLKDLTPHLKPTHCLMSICAGLTVKRLKKWTDKTCPVVRYMPNTPAMVNQGVFALCLDDEDLTDAQKTFAKELVEPLGAVFPLPEKDFDAFTAVVGSGPAYVFYWMEACIEAAVNLGIARPQATQMVYGLFAGSTKLAQESDKHVSVLREMVTSPAGTTIKALIHMD